MRFSHIFIDRPILATVLSVFITLVGLGALVTLPIAQYPEIAPPTIQITATYPGASAEVVAQTVATPLEQQINGVQDMLYLGSQATGDGKLTITATFKLGTNLDTAQVLTQNRVSIALPRLPDDVQRLGVTVKKSTPNILLVVHMISTDGTRDQLYISNYATLHVKDVLSRLNGVGDVQLFGSRDYAMRIWLDPDKIAAYGMTGDDVVTALRAQNVQVSAGILNQPPLPSHEAFQLNVQTLGRLQTPQQFADVVIKSDNNGRVTRIRDVARTEIGGQDYGAMGYLDKLSAVPLLIFAQPGSNALAVEKSVRATMAKLSKDFPPGLGFNIIYDPTEFISQSVHEVIKTILVAILLVVAVVIVFLQTWRASLIPVIAIPVSLIGAFTILATLGFSLNNLSLFGLVLAVGIVVDDAIVVVENVERNIAAGMSPKAAAHRTMDEVGGALIAIALTLCAVFVPTAFISGISGKFFQQFAVDNLRLHADFLPGLADAQPGPLRPPVQAARHPRAGREAEPADARRAGVLRAVQPRLRRALRRLWPDDDASRAVARHRPRRLCLPDRPDRAAILAHAHRLHPGAGPGLPDHRPAASPGGLARPHRGRC